MVYNKSVRAMSVWQSTDSGYPENNNNFNFYEIIIILGAVCPSLLQGKRGSRHRASVSHLRFAQSLAAMVRVSDSGKGYGDSWKKFAVLAIH